MRIRTLSQILAEGSESMFDFDDLIIEKNFLTKGKTWVISGASGIGKSVLAMQLALGLALGEKTLGLDVFKPAKTLLMHNENPILDERDYFRGIVSQFALDKMPNFGWLNENLRFVCKTGCYYSVDEFISKLDTALSAGKYDVVIVDSLSSFVHCNFSDHAAVADLFCKINGLKSKHNFAMVLIHHFDKPMFWSKRFHPAKWCMGGKAIGVYANIMSALVGTKEESIFSFRHYKPFEDSEISQTLIAQCQNGNTAWEEVENV